MFYFWCTIPLRNWIFKKLRSNDATGMKWFSQVSAELLSSHPGSVDGLTLKALLHVAKEQHKQAEERCETQHMHTCIYHKPTWLKPLDTYLLTLLHSFREALSRSPDNGELFFLLGSLYWNMGEEIRRDRSKTHTHLLKVKHYI